jgi:hypothetical protein
MAQAKYLEAHLRGIAFPGFRLFARLILAIGFGFTGRILCQGDGKAK